MHGALMAAAWTASLNQGGRRFLCTETKPEGQHSVLLKRSAKYF